MINNNNINDLKSVAIGDYLHAIGHDVAGRKNFVAFWRGDHNASVSIDHNKNVWYDHGTGEGGSVIDLVMRVEECDFAEACRKLENFSFNRSYTHITPKVEPRESGIVIDDVRELQHPALLQYLDERCIPIEIARKYCKEVHYHPKCKPSVRYFVIGFPNDEGGWELRNRFFKGATNKATTYIQNYGSVLIVFEGFMDFLSYLAMPEGVIPKVPFANFLILNSVAQAQKAVDRYKEIQPKWHEYGGQPLYKIHYCLDNDPAGIDTTFYMANIGGMVGSAGFEDLRDKMVTYSGYLTVDKIKDLNDLLIAVKKRGGEYGC